jgi:tetratricopeptide (TPR) repeat protein
MSPPTRDSAVPASVRKALERGLSIDPDERFSDMGKLLRALQVRSRRRLLLPLALLLAIAAATYERVNTSAQAPCTSADAELAEVWNAARADAVGRAIAQLDHPYAREARPLVLDGLERYARAWRVSHRDACLANRQLLQSDSLFDDRMSCLANRKRALELSLALLDDVDERSIVNAVNLVENLPNIEYCGDAEALSAEIPPPEDPETRRSVAALGDELARATALEHAGRYHDALSMVTESIERTEPLGYRPLQAEYSLVEGRILLRLDERRQSIEPLRRALHLGLEVGMDTLAVEAWARLVYARGTLEPSDGPALFEFSPAMEAISRRASDASFVRSLLFNNLGTVHLARQERDLARAQFERAMGDRRGPGAPGPAALEVLSGQSSAGRIELLQFAQNLAMVTPDPTQREALLNKVAQELDQTLGASHPKSMRQRVHQASYVRSPRSARALLEPVCELYRNSAREEQESDMLLCLRLLALLEAELGETERAVVLLSEFLQRAPTDNAYQQDTAFMASARAALLRGRARAALAEFAEARARLPTSPETWWLEKAVGDAELGAGQSHLALGEHRAAIAALERACAIFEKVVGISYNAEYRHRLAATRWALARALWAERGSDTGPADTPDKHARRARVVEHARNAATWYQASGQQLRARELEAFIRLRVTGSR